jgi:AAA+ ATPase superfamily predicted ATPase
MNFIGRKNELKALSSAYSSDKQELIVINGAKGVGKTETAKKSVDFCFIKHYFVSLNQTNLKDNLQRLVNCYGNNTNSDKKADLDAFFELLIAKSSDNPTIFIIDNYSYLEEEYSDIDSVLISLLDKYRNNSKLKLVLIENAYSLLKQTISKKFDSKITLLLTINQLSYKESSLFYSNFNNTDKLMIYSAFGGFPRYNALVDKYKSPQDNIKSLILNKNSLLSSIPESTINYYFRKADSVNSALKSTASGLTKFSDIQNDIGDISSPALSVVLNNLELVGIVNKSTPLIYEKEITKTKTEYRMADNFLAFYYRYVFGKEDQLTDDSFKTDDFYRKNIKNDFLTNIISETFSSICYQFLIQRSAEGTFDKISEIGKTFFALNTRGKLYEIKLAIKTNSNSNIYCLIKFGDESLTGDEIRSFENELGKIGLKYSNLCFFSANGFSSDAINYSGDKGFNLFSLAEMYK